MSFIIAHSAWNECIVCNLGHNIFKWRVRVQDRRVLGSFFPPRLSLTNYFGAPWPLLKELSLFEISYLSRP